LPSIVNTRLKYLVGLLSADVSNHFIKEFNDLTEYAICNYNNLKTFYASDEYKNYAKEFCNDYQDLCNYNQVYANVMYRILNSLE